MLVPTHINIITANDGTKAVVIGLDLIVPLDAAGIPEIVAELVAGRPQDNNETQDTEDSHEQ